MNSLVMRLAQKIKEKGGRAMLVGGCVRDEFLNKSSKDIDIEVYNLESEVIKEVLETFGKVDAVGSSFAVYKLGQDIDVSLPRREKKVGVGHKGFEVTGDPYMTFEEACSRRDFTINAIMKDPLTNEIIDPFNGLSDIRQGLLRAVSENTFKEDSLRVLRLVQFSSRFRFRIEDETFLMACDSDLSDLPVERVWEELEKMLMKSPDVSEGVFVMNTIKSVYKLFPSLEGYGGRGQALRKVPHYCNDLTYGEKLAVIIAVLILESDIKVLDEFGVNSVKGYPVRKQVEKLRTAWDLYWNSIPRTDYELHKFSQKVNMNLFSKILFAVSGNEEGEVFTDAIDRLDIRYMQVAPFISGKDLIAHGMPSCKEMGLILDKLYDLQLRGASKQELEEQSYGEVGAYLEGEW